MITLAIVDDSMMLRMGLKTALESGCGIELVGVFDLADEFMPEIVELRPDLVLMSMKWPAMGRIAVCRNVRRESPATRVLMLASEVRDEEVLASIMAGASGYIAMNARRPELIRAIHVAAGGGSYFESSMVDRVVGRLHDMNSLRTMHQPDDLTEREVLVLNMIAEGLGNEKIGEYLSISDRTVRNNITELRTKLDLHSRAQLAAYAARREILHQLSSMSNS